MNEAQLGGTGAVDSKNVHISMKLAGLLDSQIGFFRDRTATCSTSIESLPWTTHPFLTPCEAGILVL